MDILYGMELGRCKNVLIKAAYIAMIVAVIFILFRWLVPLLLPFLIAFVVAALVRPVALSLEKRVHIPYKLSACILAACIFLLIALLVLLLGTELFSFAKSMVAGFEDRIAPLVDRLFEKLIGLVGDWSGDIAAFLYDLKANLVTTLGQKVADVSTNVLTQLAQATPQALLSVLFFIIATFFIALDYEVLYRGLERRMSEKQYQTFLTGQTKFKKTVGTFLRSYALIFLITFAQLAVGLVAAGIQNPLLFAFFIAVFDILPVVGSGMVLLPWALITLIQGNVGRGVALLLVYLFVVISRQFLEPKIVGKNTGLHPVLTLILMYVGLRLFGGIGLFGLPLLAALLRGLEQDGTICLFPKRKLPPLKTTCKKRTKNADSF